MVSYTSAKLNSLYSAYFYERFTQSESLKCFGRPFKSMREFTMHMVRILNETPQKALCILDWGDGGIFDKFPMGKIFMQSLTGNWVHSSLDHKH